VVGAFRLHIDHTPDRCQVLGRRIEVEPEDHMTAGSPPFDHAAGDEAFEQDVDLFCGGPLL
jgi:hypothetical protein